MAESSVRAGGGENIHDFSPHLKRKMPDMQGSGGGGGNLDARVNRLETKLDGVEKGLHGVEVNLATLTERVAHLPGKGFIVGSALTSLTVITGLIVFADKIQALLAN